MASREGIAPDYRQACDRFRAAAAHAGAALGEHQHPGRGPRGEELAIDTARVGPIDASAVVMIVSGTHGVEGFGGSACQSRWLETADRSVLPDDLALLFVHAFNPYGFAWVRRVNEDNVDINRNFVDFDAPPANAGYDELAEALAPPEWTVEAQEATGARILEFVAVHGAEATQEAVSRGQYDHPEGLYYGGDRPSWSHQVLEDIASTHLRMAKRIVILDLHTGLGRFGELELITHEPPGTGGYERAVAWWGDRVASTVSGDSLSADLSGEWIPALQAWWSDAEVTGVALEWGTTDVLQVLQALRADNWLHVHADPLGPEAAEIKRQLREAFAPEDPAWIEAVWSSFTEVVDRTLTALSG